MKMLEKILTPEHIFLDLLLSSKKRVLEKISSLLETELNLSRRIIFDAFFVREKLGTTGIGGGIAIPHARLHGLEEAICVFIRLEKSLSFQAIDNKPVDLLFALLVPEDCSEMHLQLLSELAAKFSKENFTNSLRLAKDKQRVMELFAMN